MLGMILIVYKGIMGKNFHGTCTNNRGGRKGRAGGSRPAPQPRPAPDPGPRTPALPRILRPWIMWITLCITKKFKITRLILNYSAHLRLKSNSMMFLVAYNCSCNIVL